MKELVKRISRLKQGKIKKIIDKRMKEFKNNRNPFSELCFCILTANFQAEKSIKIQNELCDCFATLPKARLAARLKKLGHRFPNMRAEYIDGARSCSKELAAVVRSRSEKEIREWIVKNVRGIGYKEASHFLRNIGFTDSAIIDFHILDVLVEHSIIKRPEAITPNKYLEIEEKLRGIGKAAKLNLAELDLYLWYMETGKILK